MWHVANHPATLFIEVSANKVRKKMGAIWVRKREDGTTAYAVQIRQKDQGVIVHTEAQTFTQKALVQAWF